MRSGIVIYPDSREGPVAYSGMSDREVNYLLSISTIDGLFALIQEEKSSALSGVYVGYNAELGYPEMFVIFSTDPEVMDGFYGIMIPSLSPS